MVAVFHRFFTMARELGLAATMTLPILLPAYAAEGSESMINLPSSILSEIRAVAVLPTGNYKEVLALEAEGPMYSHKTGTAINDAGASGEMAWGADLDAHKPGHLLYGPYAQMEPGNYVVFFRLRATEEPSGYVIARIDACTSAGRKILGERELNCLELPGTEYVQVPLGFSHPGGKLECRLYWDGNVGLVVDKVTIFRLTSGNLKPAAVGRVPMPVASGLPKDLAYRAKRSIRSHLGEGELLPRSGQPDSSILVMDIREQARDWQLLLYSLQGIVNRVRPRIYYITNDQDKLWLDWMLKRGWIKSTIAIEQPEDLLCRFRSSVKGAVIPDPALPATKNVATMIAGVENALVTSSRLQKKLSLPVVEDLRGRWKTSVEAYRWALTTLWPRMNHNVLACLWPECNEVRDYLVQHKIFIFWIPGPIDGAAPYSTPNEELKFAEELLALTPANTPIMGYSYAGPDVGIGEFGGVALFSEFGKFLVGSVNSPNLSVHSGIRIEKLRQPVQPTPPLLEDKVYVCFTISDGDNIPVVTVGNWPQLWADRTRGEFPVGWTISPCAWLLIPGIADYYYATATPNDTFMAAVSGVGYCYPEFYGKRFRESDRLRVLDGFLSLTDHHMDKMDLRAVCPSLATIPDIDRYAKHVSSAQAIFPDYGRKVADYEEATYITSRGIPVFRAATGWDPNASRDEQVKLLAAQIREMTGANRPAFLHVFICNWFWDLPAMKDVLKELGTGYVAVGPDQLAALFKLCAERRQVQVGKLPNIAFFEGQNVQLTTIVRNTTSKALHIQAAVTSGLNQATVNPSSKNLRPGEEFVLNIAGIPTGDRVRLELRGSFGIRSREAAFWQVRTNELAGSIPEKNQLSSAAFYEAESLQHNSGRIENDPEASSQAVWSSPSDDKTPSHIVYGPYTSLDPGRYLAVFRLKRTAEGSGLVARLDTCTFGAVTITSSLDVTADELPMGEYRAFPLVFDHPGGPFETRVFWTGNAPVAVDHVAVWKIRATAN